MQRITFFVFMLFGFILSGSAQSITPAVISSLGDFNSTSQGSVSWTLGEPISGSYSNNSYSISTGMQQNDLLVSSLIHEATSSQYIVSYPNPVTDALQINFSGMEKGKYQMEIVNVAGETLYRQTETITDGFHQLSLNFNTLPAGNYLLHISNTREVFKVIKIQKNN